MSVYKKKYLSFSAFSLIELLISLIVISCITAAFTPVITKKMKNTSVSLNSASSEITTDCSGGGEKYGSDCKLCTKDYCIDCGLNSCASSEYLNTRQCRCAACSEKYGEICLNCNNNNCTLCKSTHYLKDGICTPCPSGSYCDGKDIYATCPSGGYYCDSSGIHRCANKYSSFCSACNSSSCTDCGWGYFLSGGTCKKCSSGCGECINENHCTKCNSGLLLDDEHACSIYCWNPIPGCSLCTNETTCTSCKGGYFLNSSNTCTECTIENCLSCVEKNAANHPACATCKGGHYLESGLCKTCASKFDANCIACDSTQCHSCAQGYHLAKDKKSCVNNDNKFNCSDSNFMQIGNLCVTRKNMGDSNLLTIPNTVLVAQAEVESCYSLNSKCCWKGTTSSPCNSDNGGYSGCTRTVCDWEAAKEICAKFNYGGKTWRLATQEEMKNWGQYSINLGVNGLMFCDQSSGYSSAQCNWGVQKCKGQNNDSCDARLVWSQNSGSTGAQRSYVSYGTWINGGWSSNTAAASVRCVTEME